MAAWPPWPAKAAALRLGISYPTIKQWIYKRKLRTIKTSGGHHRIPEAELDQFLSLPSALASARLRLDAVRLIWRMP